MDEKRHVYRCRPGGAAGSAGAAMAQAVKEQAKQADFLFVQTAKGMTFDNSTSKLTLEGVSSVTLFFSDRPNASPEHEDHGVRAFLRICADC